MFVVIYLSGGNQFDLILGDRICNLHVPFIKIVVSSVFGIAEIFR